jgi:hypothetical protein
VASGTSPFRDCKAIRRDPRKRRVIALRKIL